MRLLTAPPTLPRPQGRPGTDPFRSEAGRQTGQAQPSGGTDAKTTSKGLTLRKKLVKGESSQNVKPFVETLRVTNPVRQSRASSREASLAWGRATATAKR